MKELKPKLADNIKDQIESTNNKEMSTIEKVNLWLPTDKAKPNSLDENKKLDLLSQLNAIDDGRSTPYTPSFNSTDKKNQNGFSHKTPQFEHDEQNNFEESKHDKKSGLMTELFGSPNDLESKTFKPFKTSLKTSQGSGKSVKFVEGKTESLI